MLRVRQELTDALQLSHEVFGEFAKFSKLGRDIDVVSGQFVVPLSLSHRDHAPAHSTSTDTTPSARMNIQLHRGDSTSSASRQIMAQPRPT